MPYLDVSLPSLHCTMRTSDAIVTGSGTSASNVPCSSSNSTPNVTLENTFASHPSEWARMIVFSQSLSACERERRRAGDGRRVTTEANLGAQQSYAKVALFVGRNSHKAVEAQACSMRLPPYLQQALAYAPSRGRGQDRRMPAVLDPGGLLSEGQHPSPATWRPLPLGALG